MDTIKPDERANELVNLEGNLSIQREKDSETEKTLQEEASIKKLAESSTSKENFKQSKPKIAALRSWLVFSGAIFLVSATVSLIGYYHAQKRYSEPSYLWALAAKRIQVADVGGKCYLVYRWEDGKQFAFDVDTDSIQSCTGTAIPNFAAAKHLLIPMNDEVTQAIVAGGLIASVKGATSKALAGGGNSRAKIAKVGLVIIGAVSGYYIGDVIYRKVNPPEYSDQMAEILERQDAWAALEKATWGSLASHYTTSGQKQMPSGGKIESSNILAFADSMKVATKP